MKREWLVSNRKSMGLTQGDVAKEIGISRSYYTQIETGERTPSGLVALKISNLYGIDMNLFYQSDLFCRTAIGATN